MGLPLLSLCQRALREKAVFAVPSTIIDNNNVTAIRLQMAADRTGRALRDLGAWSYLWYSHQFNTVIGQSYALLPDAYQRVVNGTVWNATRRYKLIGPMPQKQLSAGYGSGYSEDTGGPRFFNIGGGSIYLLPTPVLVESITFDYFVKWWVRVESDPTPTKEYFSADTDTCIFPDDLMILGIKERYQAAILGVDFVPSPEYNALLSAAVPAEGGTPVVDYGGRMVAPPMASPDAVGNIPESSWPP